MQRPAFSHLFDDGPQALRGKIIGIFSLLLAANIGVWVWALTALHARPALLGTALLAYTFGLRHAVDADHIAAIDNTTRKLMQTGKRPVAVGFFFSLGHSTIVIGLSIAVAFAAVTLKARFEDMKDIGGVIGTSVSASFLLVLAIVNVLILISVVKTFRRVQRGERLVEEDLDMLLNKRGFLSRIFRPLFRLVSRSWHMYPIGFLFGLGFDTATEVALFGISAAQAADGMSLGTILIFPALFTAGMCLVDTADGVLMLGAYGWAFMKPVRKLYYNITITFVSVIVAVLIGGIEALALIADKLELKGGFWDLVGAASDNFGLLGYAVIGLFVLSWLVSVVVYKIKGYDDMPVNLG
ncbi:MAG TPA: HoxN/HupN/NixA family nickel/cobalt transporter [Paraburkholderia sp.]|uniref:HoxN/HupN/NixA family nickel/cobalt transporter n=1 Tax=Paraburkholderia sp. TaxID=1926495 RepID=UPI002CEF6EB7|nr:HoxN/HupN/NixA family nickel/cobalt transporter [Paraburkholderia sp.]HTR08572.1 HoxN/HupN/NixA family nickel/cobalt transporter [Paraburkholderia sp.]